MDEKQNSDFLSERFEKDFRKAPRLPKHFESLLAKESEIADLVFNSILPSYYRSVATIHWTPVPIIKLIAEMLSDAHENTRFLDIGSGCGKLCIILSYLTKMQIVGIEQRKDLYDIAHRIKTENGLSNVSFKHGNFMDFEDWDSYDVIYLYNPFQEHITEIEGMRIDDNIEFARKYFTEYINGVFWQLCFAKPGKKMITYHGYGGRVPDTWKLLKSYVFDGSDLSFWEKVR